MFGWLKRCTVPDSSVSIRDMDHDRYKAYLQMEEEREYAEFKRLHLSWRFWHLKTAEERQATMDEAEGYNRMIPVATEAAERRMPGYHVTVLWTCPYHNQAPCGCGGLDEYERYVSMRGRFIERLRQELRADVAAKRRGLESVERELSYAVDRVEVGE